MRPEAFVGLFKALIDAKLKVPIDMAAIVGIARRIRLEFLEPNPLAM
jgi:hypothetical protein